jgi:hypothetical protein
VQSFDAALANWIGHPTTCGTALAIEHSGDLTPATTMWKFFNHIDGPMRSMAGLLNSGPVRR